MHRLLVRNGLVNHTGLGSLSRLQRWQRDTSMQLWQICLMSGVFLSYGQESKLLTGIDDCSRCIVITTVLPTGLAVCRVFIEAMRRFGVPRRC